MARNSGLSHKHFGTVALALLIWAPSAGPAVSSEPLLFVPGSKVQVNVIQWNPTKGTYEQWSALGGTFIVSRDGEISLPVVGPVDVAGRADSDLSHQIAGKIQAKLGLISPPDVSVEMVEYPPVYVVGAVNAPGAYQFRPGLTVLQALALGGGQYRAAAEKTAANQITLAGEFATLKADKLRLVGRIARLNAEMAGKPEIDFPAEFAANSDLALENEITGLERIVFSTRQGEVTRQAANSAELRELYTNEISVLQAKIEASDHAIELVQNQLDSVEQLVKRGIATTSRQSDIELTIATMRVGRLDEDTELMRARQNLAQEAREQVGRIDQRTTSVALELRDTRADLDRLETREKTLHKLLINAEVQNAGEDTQALPRLTFVLVRNDKGTTIELGATESTLVEPGDVIKVGVSEPLGGADQNITALPEHEIQDNDNLARAGGM